MKGIDSKKLLGTVLGVAAMIIVVVGATYAWFTWASTTTSISGSTSCFDIFYAKGTDIVSGSLLPSSSYSGGLNTTIKANVKTGCLSGTLTFKLTTTTLSAAQGKTVNWGGSNPPLHFAVYKGATLITSGSGNITATGTITIGTDTLVANASAATTEYKVYIWLEGQHVNNDFIGATYAGYVHAEATQQVPA